MRLKAEGWKAEGKKEEGGCKVRDTKLRAFELADEVALFLLVPRLQPLPSCSQAPAWEHSSSAAPAAFGEEIGDKEAAGAAGIRRPQAGAWEREIKNKWIRTKKPNTSRI